jgi:aminoglycoside/choline kinase family phosphotransferase
MKPDPFLHTFISVFLKDMDIHSEGVRLTPLVGDGSIRAFFRIIPEQPGCPSFVLMTHKPTHPSIKKENLAHLMIGNHLYNKGLPVPKIHRFDMANGWFIMEDLGDTHLQEEVLLQKDPIPLYEKILESLFRLQVEGAQGFNAEWCCQTERYDRNVMRRYEADYFRDAFLAQYLGKHQDWSHLEGPFNHLAVMASRPDNHHFLHRDFQSRNIMISDHKIHIIDWQGARLGPLAYDVASLLIDPYVDLLEHEKEQIYGLYILLLKDYRPIWMNPFKRYFPYVAVQRNLQILGAFSYLSNVQKKPFFKTFIPAAVKSLQTLLERIGDPQLKALKDVVDSLTSIEI